MRREAQFSLRSPFFFYYLGEYLGQISSAGVLPELLAAKNESGLGQKMPVLLNQAVFHRLFCRLQWFVG
jgi:hypothetical protein